MRRRKKKVSSTLWTILVVVFVFIFISQLKQAEEITIPQNIPQPTRIGYHVHADFLVVMNGNEVDFAKSRYDAVDPGIHLHVRNFRGGSVIHIESRESALDDFFFSLGMLFNSTCFVLDESEYCNNQQTIKFYVNGIQNSEYENYRPKDLDRILITYGSETQEEIEKQVESVSNLACVFSNLCPPPEEAEGKIIYN